MPSPWRRTGSREIYRNQWLGVREDTIVRPASGPGIYSVVERLDALVVVPRHADGTLTLVRQYRYPVDAYSWEMPSGTLEPGEVPDEAARRELVEETGLTGARWTLLGNFWIAPGFCTQLGHVYLAEDLTQGESRPDTIEEDLHPHRFTRDDLRGMIARGELLDGLAIIALSLLDLHDGR